MYKLRILLHLVVGLVALKAVWLGSDFSFHHWFKYGKRYTRWYANRPKFDPKASDRPESASSTT